MVRFVLASLLVLGAFANAGATATPKTVWSTALAVPVYAPPQARGGSVFLTSTQPAGPNLFAVDGQTGRLIWRYATQGAIGIPPTVGTTQVFVASDIGNTHFLRAVDAKTGVLIWQ